MTHLKPTQLLIALLLSLLPLCTAVGERPLRVLAIGNSFSEDAIEHNLHELAKADGTELIIGNLYIGGCTLARHWKNASANLPEYRYRKIDTDGKTIEMQHSTLERALKDEQWDYISLQQASGISGLEESYEPYLGQLIDYIRSLSPHSRIIWHQTWAYAHDATHPEFPNYGRSQQRMYHMICQAARKAMKQHGIHTVVPSGTAIQNARGSWIGDKMNRDGYHLNLVYGRYTAACTWLEALTHHSVVGNSYAPAGMSPRLILTTQKAAHYAVKHPWKVSKIKE